MQTLTDEKIHGFCDRLQKQGKHSNTIRIYRNSLFALQEFLPEDKQITEERLEAWKKALLESDYSSSTVHLRIAAVNQFLQAQEADHLLLDQVKYEESTESELSRAEYRRLLQAAKIAEKDRTYFLIKAFASIGLSAKDVPLLTVQALQIGRIPVYDKGYERGLYIPYPIRQELREYAASKGIQQGPILITGNGKPISRVQAHLEIKAIAKDAAVDEEKVNIRNLQKLCADTQKKIQDEVMILVENRYDQLLEAEQPVYGWSAV